MSEYIAAMQHTTPPKYWRKNDDGVWEKTSEQRDHCAQPPYPPNSREAGKRTYSTHPTTPPADSLIAREPNGGETDPTSISYPQVEREDQEPKSRRKKGRSVSQECQRDDSSERSSSGSGTSSPRRGSPSLSFEKLTAGMGEDQCRKEHPRRHLSGLLESNDEYTREFITRKKWETFAKAAAKPEGYRDWRLDSGPYSLSAFPHDDLTYSNGPARVNEERAAICAFRRGADAEGHRCDICQLPPDYYDCQSGFYDDRH